MQKQKTMAVDKAFLETTKKDVDQRYDALTQGVEMCKSFFKEYYDQISDFDPFIDARVNVLNEVQKQLESCRVLEHQVHAAWRQSMGLL